MAEESINAALGGTLTEVAQRAGVNKVTASMVLSGGGGNTRVSEATRQRIIQAAEELRYRRNPLARTLRDRKTRIIGLYIGGFIDIRNNFLGEVMSGLQQGCEQNRHDFLMHGTFRGNSVDDIYAELANGKVDGLVVLTNKQPELIYKLAASHLPIIALADPHPKIASVSVDDVRGSRMLAELLASRGHRHVLYGVCPYPLSSATRRLKAFQDAAQELGIVVSTRIGRGDGGVVSEAEVDFLAWRGGADRKDLDHRNCPTAIVCWNDEMAHGVIDCMADHGVRVPEDVAVVGFDGWELSIKPRYRLTTVRAPWRDAARLAVDLLVTNPGKLAEEDTILPVELVAGNTA